MNLRTHYFTNALNYDMRETQTCHLVAIEHPSLIQDEPYLLACGEWLNKGDRFTQLGTAKSASAPNIKMEDGWVQEFDGIITVPHEYRTGSLQEIALMSAYDSTGRSAVEHLKARFRWPHIYIAYHLFSKGRLHFSTPSPASRLINCDVIHRAK